MDHTKAHLLSATRTIVANTIANIHLKPAYKSLSDLGCEQQTAKKLS